MVTIADLLASLRGVNQHAQDEINRQVALQQSAVDMINRQAEVVRSMQAAHALPLAAAAHVTEPLDVSRMMSDQMRVLHSPAVLPKLVMPDFFKNAMKQVGDMSAHIARVTKEVLTSPAFGNAMLEVTLQIPKILQELELAKERRGWLIVDAYGFGFAPGWWERALLMRLVYVSPRARGAAVTNVMLGALREEEFRADIETTFVSSPTLRWRWRHVEDALLAHDERRYGLAVGTFLQHTEGIIQDGLILDGKLARRGNNLIVLDDTGRPKLGSKGKEIVVHGTGQIFQQVRLADDHHISRPAHYFTDEFLPESNPIRHGQMKRYATPKRSARFILMLYFWAKWVEMLEQ